MAISHVSSLLLLLASLFFLPAYCGVPFEDCGEVYYPANVTSVDMIRDERWAGFKISGTTSKTITIGEVQLDVYEGMIRVMKQKYELCAHTASACPVVPGAFVFSFENIIPFRLGREFKSKVYIHDYEEGLVCIRFDSKLPATVLSA
ncbi:hypothetical protein AALP_AA8G168200 [Arabis alpina]|uniref:MD-2-related lipid-recognition domain-containing protein n=1 Tax=Arabis alpina TaxID=50452 RepID=A0A087G7I2_ARAAL|nr:hypothetical protein AALP_AA8G168200 [Arabis alpina]